MREALLAYEALLRAQARTQYEHEVNLYVMGGLKQKPKPDPILLRPARAD